MASQAEERSRGAKKGAEHDEDIMYGHGPLSIEEINAKYDDMSRFSGNTDLL